MSVYTLSISHEGSDFFIRLIAANVRTMQVAIMMEWTQSPSRSGLYYEDFVAQEELDLLLDLHRRSTGTTYETRTSSRLGEISWQVGRIHVEY